MPNISPGGVTNLKYLEFDLRLIALEKMIAT
jgi:hypothetical protein